MGTEYDLLKNAIILDTECLSGDTLVQQADGTIIEIQDYQSGDIWGSSCDNTSRRAGVVGASQLTQKSPKHCYSVRAKWGLPVVASDKHLFLTQDGWKYTKDLTTSDYLLISNGSLDLPENLDWSDDELSFIGWWIAEGCRVAPGSKSRSVSLSIVEPEYIQLLPKLDDSLKITQAGNNCVRYSLRETGRDVDGTYRVNPAAELLERLDLLSKYCWEKEIPEELHRLSHRQLSILIGAMWAGDGTVFKDRLGLSYTTTSRRLAEQLVLLLSRVKVLASLSVHEDNRKESYKATYSVQVSGDAAAQFWCSIRLPGRKDQELEDSILEHTQRKSQKRIPRILLAGWRNKWLEFIGDIRHPKTGCKAPYWLLKQASAYSLQSFIYGTADLPVDALIQLERAFPEFWSDYQIYNFEGLVWAQISSIEDAGIHEVWDITTSTGEFIANGVVVHNTTGLARGSGIHELAIFDLDKQKVYEYLLKPQLVFAKDRNMMQDVTRLASSSLDEHFIVEGINTWQDLITAQVAMDTGANKTDVKAVERALQWSNPFLANALKSGKYPHLIGKPDSPQAIEEREKLLKDMGGIKASLGNQAAIEDVLRPGSAFLKKLRGKTVWIANANFESKMLGAQIDAMTRAGHDIGMKRMLETSNPASPDPTFVTGKEVNAARAFAQQTGDWTQVWKAYLANPPKAGETAVRDIQDVTRAFMSYGQKLGLIDIKDQYFGTAIDTTYRLFGSLEKDPEKARQMLMFDEVHRAAEDAAISEHYVLKRATKYTSALQEVAEGTERGKMLLQQAMAGEGEFAEAGRYFARLNELAGDIQRVNLIKRVARAQEDFLVQDQSFQISGIGAPQYMKQETFEGKPIDVVRARHTRSKFSSMKEVVDFIGEQPSYSRADISASQVYERMESFLAKGDDKRELLSRFVEQETTTTFEGRKMGMVEAKIKASADILLNTENRRMGKIVTDQVGRKVGDILRSGMQNISTGTLGKGAMAGAAMMTLGGAVWSMADGSPQEPRTNAPSIVSYNYHEWQERQSAFYGNRQHDAQGRDGLQPTGIAAKNRSKYTDFGSPYRGPFASNQTLVDQELLRERERWLREQYGARHYDPLDGVFGVYGAFKNFDAAGRRGYSYVQEGTPVNSQDYAGLRGTGYMVLNLSDGSWKMNVEDVDTIIIQRGGVRGAVSSFFGMNKRFKFRLSGIDSTEVTHGFFNEDGGGYHAPQPFAQQSTEAMKQLLSDKKISLVFDPSQTTYGRMLGVVYADGKNMNVEAVKRGYAAFLPFGKSQDAMQNWGALRDAETRAVQAKRGLWSQPWAQAFYDFSEASGNRMTFNTLARKDRIVQKTAVMSQISLMETAQAQGFYSTANRMAAAQLGKHYDFGADNVQPTIFDVRNAPHNNHLHEMLTDTADFVRTKGTGRTGFKYSRRGGYGNLDNKMALDTMGTTNTIWNKRELQAFDTYGSKSKLTARRRKQQMASEQRRINQEFGVSPINHQRM